MRRSRAWSPRAWSDRTEREVARALHWEMLERGAEGRAFEAIVAAGEHGARPHATPRDVPIPRGELVVIDWGATFGGYRSDCTRTVAAGAVDAEEREIYELVLSAQLAGLEAIKAGACGRDVDGAARDVIEGAGQGAHFGHGLGHGVGLDIHEAPRLSRRSDSELAAGNVVTVEPGVYLPGRLGVRIEDLVVVTDRQRRDPYLGEQGADRHRLAAPGPAKHATTLALRMISTNQFRNGSHIDVDGTVFKIVEFQHVKPGKGGAFVRTKLRRASDGAVIDRTFRAGEKFRPVRTEVRRMQFLYRDGSDAHFMDSESYEQLAIPEPTIADALRWMRESEEVELLYIDGQPADVQLPSAIDLAVSETDPGLRGDTASGGGTKPAVLETGARIQVPLFIDVGEKVRVDTRTGEYVSRA